MASFLISTGGTGGHIFPALSVGKILKDMGNNIIFIVRQNQSDISLIEQYGFEYYTIPISGFFGKKIKEKISFVYNLTKAMVIFPQILLKTRPASIIASGGYPSLVPILWSIITHKKYFLIEQNRIAGRLTKYFARWASVVFLGFPLMKKLPARTIYTGNALKPEINFASKHRNDDGKTILVLGGSQGANFINQNIIEVALRMNDFNFIIQTGKKNYTQVIESLKIKTNSEPISETIDGINYQTFTPNPNSAERIRIFDFTMLMEKLYKKTTIVISRAGGMVLSEILSFGIPSIIIPFPFATDNHQAANAQFLAQNNAAIILDQRRHSGVCNEFIKKLQLTLESIIYDKNKLNEMSSNALAIAQTNSAETIARYIVK